MDSAPREARRSITLSVVFVTFNSAGVIGRALDAAVELAPGAEIIVVDNGSTDATVQIARTHGAQRVVHGHGNVGFGGGVNRGARAAGGQLLLVLNPDAVLREVDIGELGRLAMTPKVGIQRCDFGAFNGHAGRLDQRWCVHFELYWALVTWFLVPREITLRRPHFPWLRLPRWVHGAAFLVSRDEFLRLGGFDERLFLYFEDFDLSRRYDSRGLPLGTTRCASVSHAGQGSSPRREDAMVACALLSLVQYAATWDGPEAATRLARSVLRALGAIQAAARCLVLIPRLGRRGSRKAQTARTVRASLLEGRRVGIPFRAYPDAYDAFEVATKGNRAVAHRPSPTPWPSDPECPSPG